MKDTPTLLIVDDTPSNLDILIDFLQEYNIMDTTDGYDALEILEHETIDLILLDILMPNIDGLEVCRRIKNNPKTKHIPIIFITSKSDEDTIEEAYNVGGDDYIIKPFRKKELLSRVKKELQAQKVQYYLQEQLVQQSKLAQMGEMIDSIAHQWLQPLSAIKNQATMLELYLMDDELTPQKVSSCIEKQDLQITHIVNTLKEFRDFFRPNVDTQNVSLSTIIESVLLLLQDNLVHHQLHVINHCDNNIKVDVLVNEFQHIIINLINNSIDAFNENKITNRELKIVSNLYEDKVTLEIHDNAGGIPQHIINNIFDMNFTTKDKGKGSGMGLYMSMVIIKKIKGNMRCESDNNGTSFIIELPLNEIKD